MGYKFIYINSATKVSGFFYTCLFFSSKDPRKYLRWKALQKVSFYLVDWNVFRNSFKSIFLIEISQLLCIANRLSSFSARTKFRGSHWQIFFKIGFPKKFAVFTGKRIANLLRKAFFTKYFWWLLLKIGLKWVNIFHRGQIKSHSKGTTLLRLVHWIIVYFGDNFWATKSSSPSTPKNGYSNLFRKIYKKIPNIVLKLTTLLKEKPLSVFCEIFQTSRFYLSDSFLFNGYQEIVPSGSSWVL